MHNLRSCGCDESLLGTPVALRRDALDEPAIFQKLEHAPGARPIDCNQIRYCLLFKTRTVTYRDKRYVLDRRDLQTLEFVHEDCDRNLLQPPDKMTGTAIGIVKCPEITQRSAFIFLGQGSNRINEVSRGCYRIQDRALADKDRLLSTEIDFVFIDSSY